MVLDFALVEIVVLVKVVVVVGCMLRDSLVALLPAVPYVLVTLVYFEHPLVVFLEGLVT